MSPACGPIVSTQPNMTSSTAWIDSGALDQGRQGVGAEISRMHGREATAPTAHRAAHRVHDVGLRHLVTSRALGPVPSDVEQGTRTGSR